LLDLAKNNTIDANERGSASGELKVANTKVKIKVNTGWGRLKQNC
jgi:hypothetical protein